MAETKGPNSERPGGAGTPSSMCPSTQDHDAETAGSDRGAGTPSAARPSAASRRHFLKLLGGSALLGAGSVAGLGAFAEVKASDVLSNSESRGKRWAMVIDVWKLETEADYDRITEACHRYYNVPKIENPKHQVKWIWAETYRAAFPNIASPFAPQKVEKKPFLVLCNHCERPPCVRVCPVKATFRRPDGIVMQDMHRCIGCKFCMVACPYGARNYNWLPPKPLLEDPNPNYVPRMLGVVEKCNFCHERIVDGQMPVCVEASGGALVFGDLNDPGSPVSQIISSRYTIRRRADLGTEPRVFYVV